MPKTIKLNATLYHKNTQQRRTSRNNIESFGYWVKHFTNLYNKDYTKRSHKKQKHGGFFVELLSENDFEAVLTAFFCYDYGANTSEVVQTVAATDQIDYHKCSSYVIVCWIAKIYQTIIGKKGWLLGYLRRC